MYLLARFTCPSPDYSSDVLRALALEIKTIISCIILENLSVVVKTLSINGTSRFR